MDNVDCEGFGREFLDVYLSRGMGTLSKREIDILVMHLLSKHAGIASVGNPEKCYLVLREENQWSSNHSTVQPPDDPP